MNLPFQPEATDFCETLAPIAAEIGTGVALALSRQFGGMRLYIPQVWRADLDLNVLGTEPAQKLCRMFGPERVEIPIVPFTADAIGRFSASLAAQGLTSSEIARTLGVSWKRIQRARSRAGQPMPQEARAKAKDTRQIDILDWLNRRGAA